MSEDIVIPAQKREVLGKKVKQLRAQGLTPGVIHDHGKDSIHVSVDELKLKKAYSKAGKNHPVSVKAGNKEYTALIKDISYAPATSNLHHSVFQAIKADEKVSAEIPVHLVGDSPAERASLQVLKKTEYIEVESLPKYLPESFEVDISQLENAGERISVGDIKVSSDVEITTDPTNLIAIVEEPRVHEVEEPEEEVAEGEEGEEAAEGETSEDKAGEQAESEEE